jgi:RNA polymerase sigma factor (sigma-70 family)
LADVDGGYGESDDSAQRQAVVYELLLAVPNLYLTPVDETTVIRAAAQLLDEVFADYEMRELREAFDRLVRDERLHRDRTGRIIAGAPRRSPREIADAFQVARSLAQIASDHDPPRGLESDDDYMRRVLAHRLLSSEHVRRLARRAAAGDRQAINTLVSRNARLAWDRTRRLARDSTGAMDREDYFQEACLGLIRAAEKFDPDRGVRFSTYAVAWIDQRIRRAEADRSRVIRIPVHKFDDVRRVRSFIAREEERLGIAPEMDDVGRALGMAPDEVAELLDLSEPVASLEADPAVMARLENQRADGFGTPLDQSDLDEIFACELNERERQVLELRFGIGGAREHTLDQVGKLLGITRERVRQIQSSALERIEPWIRAALGD